VAIYQLCSAVTGLEENLQLHHSLFPNPSNGKFYFKPEPELQSSELIIMNILGEIIFRTYVNSQDLVIDIRDQAPGVYYYLIGDSRFTRASGKLIVQ
jgi:hypothetical protein